MLNWKKASSLTSHHCKPIGIEPCQTIESMRNCECGEIWLCFAVITVKFLTLGPFAVRFTSIEMRTPKSYIMAPLTGSRAPDRAFVPPTGLCFLMGNYFLDHLFKEIVERSYGGSETINGCEKRIHRLIPFSFLDLTPDDTSY